MTSGGQPAVPEVGRRWAALRRTPRWQCGMPDRPRRVPSRGTHATRQAECLHKDQIAADRRRLTSKSKAGRIADHARGV